MKNKLKAFHTVCHNYGITDEQKKAIYEGFNTDSSKKLTPEELQSAINFIEADAQKWRRRVMAAIGAYLIKIDVRSNANLIKSIACRATKAADFNKITIRQLRKTYNLFIEKDETVGGVVSEKQKIVNHLENIYNN